MCELGTCSPWHVCSSGCTYNLSLCFGGQGSWALIQKTAVTERCRVPRASLWAQALLMKSTDWLLNGRFQPSRYRISTGPISRGFGGRRGFFSNQKTSHCLCPILGREVFEPCRLAVSQVPWADRSWSSANMGAHVGIKASSCLCCLCDRPHVSHLGYFPCWVWQGVSSLWGGGWGKRAGQVSASQAQDSEEEEARGPGKDSL